MSVPKQHHSKLRRNRGRKRFALKAKKTVKCSKCSAAVVAHQTCPKCGFYKGKEVVNTLKKVKKQKK